MTKARTSGAALLLALLLLAGCDNGTLVAPEASSHPDTPASTLQAAKGGSGSSFCQSTPIGVSATDGELLMWICENGNLVLEDVTMIDLWTGALQLEGSSLAGECETTPYNFRAFVPGNSGPLDCNVRPIPINKTVVLYVSFGSSSIKKDLVVARWHTGSGSPDLVLRSMDTDFDYLNEVTSNVSGIIVPASHRRFDIQTYESDEPNGPGPGFTFGGVSYTMDYSVLNAIGVKSTPNYQVQLPIRVRGVIEGSTMWVYEYEYYEP